MRSRDAFEKVFPHWDSTLTPPAMLRILPLQIRRLPSGFSGPLFFVPGCGTRIMNSEILAGLDFFERDKGIKREVLLEAINNAVLTAARKAVGPARDLRVDIDSKSGDMKVYAKLTVVEKVENKHDEISFTLAKKFKN